MKKAIALILVFCIMGAGVWYLRKVEYADQENMRDLYSVVEPLQREREALAQERTELETDSALKMRDVGTVELLFRELDKRIFTEAYPQMRDRGITGVLGVSHEEYPGYNSKLTLEQYSRLIMDGWSSCFLYEGKSKNFKEWYDRLIPLLEHDKLPVPTAVFFSDDSYDSSIDDVLAECGIQTIILSNEDGHSAIVSPVGGSAFWYTGAMPWNYTGMNRDTEILARTSGANLVFTISYNNLWDAYEQGTFIQVLNNWTSMLAEDDILQNLLEPTPTPTPAAGASAAQTAEDQLNKPQLKVVTLEAARSAHEEAEKKNAELERELAAREAELDKQIAQLDEQIRAIYDQWSQPGK